ncbi:PQQ-like beta-propeller repeat protein [Blastopirellula sp. J2-11]|uniref:PQQ-like beta-propeller repeat protein n=1 Tax=Blastopirellula sp. J2-11 TaxID=2943192 RepID=UPI0021C837F9|nr:PQQ-like beta-propeller repeat protein [Blastopirellula sp. J2-11]UUO08063.1 PQQ-like beta-propeller repeat protein [Blastopirellula sp. J2-11]
MKSLLSLKRISLLAAAIAVGLLQVNFASAQLRFLPQTAPSRGQFSLTVDLPELNNESQQLLVQLEQRLRDRQWQEAIEGYRRLVSAHGDELFEADSLTLQTGDQYVFYVGLRRRLHTQLAEIARREPELLIPYRDQTDISAKAAYDAAIAAHDLGAIEQAIERYFLASKTDQALLALGDMRLERGEFAAARAAWEQIDPRLRSPYDEKSLLYALPGQPLWVAVDGVDWKQDEAEIVKLLLQPERHSTHRSVPQSEIPLADLLARLTLASALEGDATRAAIELDLLRRLAPNAEGWIAGKRQPYDAALQAILATSQGTQYALSYVDHWETFAGSPTRSAIAAQAPGAKLVAWSIALPKQAATIRTPGLAETSQSGETPLSFYPIAVGDHLFVNDAKRLRAFQLRDGSAAWPSGEARDRKNADYGAFHRSTPDIENGLHLGNTNQWQDRHLAKVESAIGAPRYTLSAKGRLMAARQGNSLSVYTERASEFSKSAEMFIIDLGAEGRIAAIIPANEPGEDEWEFEGTGLIDDGRLYVAMTKNGVRSESAVACYDASTARRIWRRTICSTEPYGAGLVLGDKAGQRSHNLLTMSDGVLYYNTNRGAISAISAATGEIQWLTIYPRGPLEAGTLIRANQQLLRELNPCVVTGDLVMAMPADCDRIVALDAATGKLQWQTVPGGVQASHLLGTTKEDLIVSGDQVYWIRLDSGRIRSQFPNPRDPQNLQAESPPQGYGRGILGRDTIYWPTLEAIYVLKQQVDQDENVIAAREPIDLKALGLTGGNLAISGDYLVIAGATQLTVLKSDASSDPSP